MLQCEGPAKCGDIACHDLVIEIDLQTYGVPVPYYEDDFIGGICGYCEGIVARKATHYRGSTV